MRRSYVFLLVITALFLLSCDTRKFQAKRELQLGVSDYKQAQYEAAVSHLRRALDLDPTLTEAVRYLASISASQASSDPSFAEGAIAQFESLEKIDPHNVDTLRGLAFLHLQLGHHDRSRAYWLKAIEVDPSDPESYYSLAVIDFVQTYGARLTRMAKLGLKPNASFISYPDCVELRSQNLDRIHDGIDRLGKALQLRPDYKDALSYMNLMYREQANTQCKNPDAYKRDIATADEWIDRWWSLNKRLAPKESEPKS
jgi:tetratricopeptide (TPR) repeat protein